MNLVLAFAWLCLIWHSVRAKDVFLSVFVATQFLFVGAGLLLCSFVPINYLSSVFSDFDFSTIDESDFTYANLLVLVGVSMAALTHFALAGLTRVRGVHGCVHYSRVSHHVLASFTIVSVAVCAYFIQENIGSFYLLALAEQGDDLASALEARYSAVSGYIFTLLIYNFCPAVVLIILAEKSMKERSWIGRVCVYSLILIVFLALILTFQKRPLIVFLFAMLFVVKAKEILSGINVSAYGAFSGFFRSSLRYFFLLFLILFGLYFFYTGYRFSSDGYWESTVSIVEVVGTRIVGRLSIPAAFYVDYFPSLHDFYGFSNVGLFAKIFEEPLFLDTSVVFSNYSYSGVDGSVAASVFSDAYGQGGPLWVPIVGCLVGCILFMLRQGLERSPTGPAKLLFMTFGIMYFYYLSQSSLFRASLGYGGIIWLLMWLVVVRRRKNHVAA